MVSISTPQLPSKWSFGSTTTASTTTTTTTTTQSPHHRTPLTALILILVTIIIITLPNPAHADHTWDIPGPTSFCIPSVSTCKDYINPPGTMPDDLYSCSERHAFAIPLLEDSAGANSRCTIVPEQNPISRLTTWFMGLEVDVNILFYSLSRTYYYFAPSPAPPARYTFTFNRPLYSPVLTTPNPAIRIEPVYDNVDPSQPYTRLTFYLSSTLVFDPLQNSHVFLTYYNGNSGTATTIFTGIGFRSRESCDSFLWVVRSIENYQREHGNAPAALLALARPFFGWNSNWAYMSCFNWQYDAQHPVQCDPVLWDSNCLHINEGIITTQVYRYQDRHYMSAGSHSRISFRYAAVRTGAICGFVPTIDLGTPNEAFLISKPCPPTFPNHQHNSFAPLTIFELPHISEMRLFGINSNDWPVLAPGEISTGPSTVQWSQRRHFLPRCHRRDYRSRFGPRELTPSTSSSVANAMMRSGTASRPILSRFGTMKPQPTSPQTKTTGLPMPVTTSPAPSVAILTLLRTGMGRGRLVAGFSSLGLKC